MPIRIGHASLSETGSINGAKGDQTGREVRLDYWYNGGWKFCLRPKRADVAERSARFCETICKNDNVGYGQNDRNSLRTEIKKIGFANAANLSVKCNTDCSAFMALCAESAGVPIRYYDLGGGNMNAQTTYTMQADYPATGEYELLTDAKYITSDKYLGRGDILVSGGHTVMVLSNGELYEGDDTMTYEDFKSFMTQYRKELQDNDAAQWSEADRQWAIQTGLIQGGNPLPDGSPNYMWDDFVSRVQVATLLHRFYEMMGGAE